jgi:hypothetical protein
MNASTSWTFSKNAHRFTFVGSINPEETDLPLEVRQTTVHSSAVSSPDESGKHGIGKMNEIRLQVFAS